LTARPLTDVVLDVTTDNTVEVAVDAGQLLFTPDNWGTPQLITVTGINDTPATVDGDQAVTVTVSVNDAVSNDAWDPLLDEIASVTNQDNDTAGFSLSKTSAVVSEGGANDAFTVVLTARPLTDVVLLVVSDDSDEVIADPVQLVFTTADWDVAREVVLSGVNDRAVDGTQLVPVTVSVDAANSDAGFAGLDAETVTVTVRDYESWTSYTHPVDVNADGWIEPLDVLILINNINEHGLRALPMPFTDEDHPPDYWDVTGDGLASAADVLAVINYINDQGPGPVPGGVIPASPTGEGEATPLPATRQGATVDLLPAPPARLPVIWPASEMTSKRTEEIDAFFLLHGEEDTSDWLRDAMFIAYPRPS